MRALGLDLSSLTGTSVFCLHDDAEGGYDEERAVKFGKCATGGEPLVQLATKQRADVVIIESCSISAHIHDVFKAAGIPIIVACVNEAPFQWNRTKRKTDRDDALRLVKLYRAGDIVRIWVPPAEVRQQRQLQRFRQRLTQRRTKIKNSIRGILEREGIVSGHGWSAWNGDGIRFLRDLANEETELDELWRFQLALELTGYEETSAHLRDVTKKLDQLGRKNDYVQLLQTIDGIGPRTAEAFVSYIGDPSRFKNGGQVSASLGLVPRQYESSTMTRNGRITKRGDKLVRTLLVEATWLSRQHNPYLAHQFDKVCRGSQARRKTAAVATARKLAEICWAMMRDGHPWNPPSFQTAA